VDRIVIPGDKSYMTVGFPRRKNPVVLIEGVTDYSACAKVFIGGGFDKQSKICRL